MRAAHTWHPEKPLTHVARLSFTNLAIVNVISGYSYGTVEHVTRKIVKTCDSFFPKRNNLAPDSFFKSSNISAAHQNASLFRKYEVFTEVNPRPFMRFSAIVVDGTFRKIMVLFRHLKVVKNISSNKFY